MSKFVPKDYQIPLVEAIDQHDFIRAIAIWPRRAGKDLTAWNICISELIKSPKTIYYVFHTFSQGRRILWEGITNDGFRLLDYLPKELIESKDRQRMRIELKNGSVFQIRGSRGYEMKDDEPVPDMVVFSEFSLADKKSYELTESILKEKKGKILIISTPNGKNHLYEMYNKAISNPDDWFVSKLTVEDTKHIPIATIMEEDRLCEMSDEALQQDFMTKFID